MYTQDGVNYLISGDAPAQMRDSRAGNMVGLNGNLFKIALANNWLVPTSQLQQPQQQTQVQTQRPAMSFNNYLDRLYGQANNSLNGGLLGYQPSQLQSPNGTQFNAPQGQFNFPFGLLRGY